MLPHSVVFAHRKDRKVTVLPIEIPQPKRTLGILHLEGRPRIPAAEKLARHISTRLDDLAQLIKRHEDAVVWGSSPSRGDIVKATLRGIAPNGPEQERKKRLTNFVLNG